MSPPPQPSPHAGRNRVQGRLGGGRWLLYIITPLYSHSPTDGIHCAKTRAIDDPLLKVPPAGRGNRLRAPHGSPREAGGTLRRGASIALVFAQCIPSVGEWLYSEVMIYNNHRPPPNLPCTRGRNSLPACGEGWGGGDMLKPLRIGTDYPRACAVSGIGLPRCLPRSCPQAASMSCPRSTRWVVSMPAASRIARNRRTRSVSGRWNPSGVGT